MWVPLMEDKISDRRVETAEVGIAEQAIPSKRDAHSRVSVSM